MTEIVEAPAQEQMPDINPPDIEVVARLSPSELQEVRRVQAAMIQIDTTYRLMQEGSRTLWNMLNAKYKLIAGDQLDYENGVLFRRSVKISPNGVAHDAPEVPGPPAASSAPVQPQPNRKARRKKR